MKFRDSELAHKLLDGLKGIEIGAAAHNPFNIKDCKFVDRTDDPNDVFKQGSVKLCGEILPVDYVAEGDDLPFEDNTWDYVLSSHVLEHFFDPIKAVKEWLRVIKPGGYVFMIVPKSRALPGENRPCTTLQELLDRHEGRMAPEEVDMTNGYQTSAVTGLHLGDHGHWSVWDLQDFIPVCDHYGWKMAFAQETDDKVGNGWTLVLRK
jgi:SAM-dependent methyltransferase